MDDEADIKTAADGAMDIIARFQSSWRIPRVGDIVEGTVLKKHGARVFMDLGFATGIIYGKEYQDGKDILKQKNVGDALVTKIVELENEDGYTELSVKEAGREKFWKEASSVLAEKKLVTAKALEANRGGLVFDWNGTKGFLPLSQLSQKHYPRVEGGDKNRILEELQKFIGEEFTLQIITIDPKEEKIIFSEKASDPDETKEKLSRYAIDGEYEGEVSGIVDFGVFVKLEEGLEGLVHISELDWSLVDNPGDLYKVGDKVSVKIMAIEGDKISLSIKALKPDPWKLVELQKGDIVDGLITKLNKYGAFVKLPSKEFLCGLSHISEFGSLQKMKETIEIGKTYPFQVVVFQPDHHKLSLAFLGKEQTETPAVAAEPKTE